MAHSSEVLASQFTAWLTHARPIVYLDFVMCCTHVDYPPEPSGKKMTKRNKCCLALLQSPTLDMIKAIALERMEVDLT